MAKFKSFSNTLRKASVPSWINASRISRGTLSSEVWGHWIPLSLWMNDLENLVPDL